jgi:hypothetical protein
LLQLGRQLIKLNDGFVKGFFIVGFNRQFQQAGNVFTPLLELIDGLNDGFERRALFTQRLCALGFVPDVRLFQLCVNFF